VIIILEKKMKILSRAEEVILLTILKLDKEAYGVSIREQIRKDTDNLWSFASIYTPLDKLHQKGYVEKIKGDPCPERGGKSKFFYHVTEEGIQALVDLQETQQRIWSGIPKIARELYKKNEG
jgi:DNA-binding PadR family transcriptional regulator